MTDRFISERTCFCSLLLLHLSTHRARDTVGWLVVGDEDLELGLTDWPSAEQNYIERVSRLARDHTIGSRRRLGLLTPR